MANANGYPTDEILNQIEQFELGTHFENLIEYLQLIKSNWWTPEWRYDIETGILQLSTFGWSGNEDIIRAMQKNLMFWSVFWYESKRGGHYKFDLFQFCDDGKRRFRPNIEVVK